MFVQYLYPLLEEINPLTLPYFLVYSFITASGESVPFSHSVYLYYLIPVLFVLFTKECLFCIYRMCNVFPVEILLIFHTLPSHRI